MNIVFVSNFFNHHQHALSDALYKLSDSYFFVSTKEMSEERRQLGYGESIIPDYVLSYNDNTKDDILQKINSADVVIAGSAPEELLYERIRKHKLIFRYSERPFKTEQSTAKMLLRRAKWKLKPIDGENIYLLCAGAYTSFDFAEYDCFINKAYKWGYFPRTIQYDTDALIAGKDPKKILWCGRFLDWKHLDDAIAVAKKLKEYGITFSFDIIGTGVMEAELKEMVSDYKLNDCVSFLGAMKPDEVRKHMEKAGIYLFTSDRQEGWGAVLNESMNSGCAVVASHAIGSVPYLIKKRENGMIYRSGDIEELYRNVKSLLEHPEEQYRLGKAAYQTITEEWNAELAAKRFVDLAQHILNGEKYPDLYKSGPCSKAEIINDDWYI